MPSFLSMRNLPDDIPPLGERLPRADEEPVRTPPDEVVRPGILRDPTTGRLRTDIPTEVEKVIPPTHKTVRSESEKPAGLRRLFTKRDFEKAIQDFAAFSDEDLKNLGFFRFGSDVSASSAMIFLQYYVCDPSTRVWSWQSTKLWSP